MPRPNLTSLPDPPEGTKTAEYAKEVARAAVADLRQDDERPLVVRLGLLSLLARQVERSIDELVQEARREGATWQQIAEVVGITRQGVRKRYDRYSSAPEVTRADVDEAVASFQVQRRRLEVLPSEQRNAAVADMKGQFADLMRHISPESRAKLLQKVGARRRIIRKMGLQDGGDEFEMALLASTVRLVHPWRRRAP